MSNFKTPTEKRLADALAKIIFLEKEIAAAQKDKERLDWLDHQKTAIDAEGSNSIYSIVFRYPAITSEDIESLRQAIDAAMTSRQQCSE